MLVNFLYRWPLSLQTLCERHSSTHSTHSAACTWLHFFLERGWLHVGPVTIMV
jgi:hypothetical protein